MTGHDFFLIFGLEIKRMFLDWLNAIFVLPFTHVDMLWILVPVWFGWLLAEIFQEKKGTSIGNAVSNSAIIIWGSVDCARQTTYWISKNPGVIVESIFRFVLILFIFTYGALIVWLGIKGKKKAKMFGRSRNVTYIFIMFVPVFYGAMPLTLNHVLGTILFFPLYYYVVEFFNRYTPDSKAIIIDSERNNVENQMHQVTSMPSNFNRQFNQSNINRPPNSMYLHNSKIPVNFKDVNQHSHQQNYRK